MCVCRNWHWDEPSCGYEVCVVMYHQPSAPPGLGGLYMFQWNDDNCETKNNFICKYTSGITAHSWMVLFIISMQEVLLIPLCLVSYCTDCHGPWY